MAVSFMRTQAKANRRSAAAGNAKIAELLRQYAAVLGMQGADQFKVKAYRKAAETIDSLGEELPEYLEAGGELEDLPGIGKAISQVIQEIVQTGGLRRLSDSLATIRPELVELLTRPALDPKKVLRTYKTLGIHTLGELRKHLESGEVGRRLGPRIEFHLRVGLDDRPRMLHWNARPLAAQLEARLRTLAGVRRVAITGSLRRRKDTVGSLDFLVAGERPSAIFKRFLEFGSIKSVKKRDGAELEVELAAGIRLRLLWTTPELWGLALLLSTGAAEHIEALAAAARRRKFELSAESLQVYGISCENEEAIYQGLGLSFIEPELREGRGEVRAAREDRLPTLVGEDDLRGDLHMHTTASDGTASILKMAEAARQKGYEYIAITDHSQSLKLTNGLSERRLREQLGQIDKLNARWDDFAILKSAEVDILEDGSLDYSDAMLRELDLTMCSIHSRFALNKQQQTERLMRAMDNPYFNILGHATGRLLLKREGYELDFERLARHARKNGCFFEINSSPDRLDLSDENAKVARDLEIKIAVNTDAHSVRELGFMSAGIQQARRAWLAPDDVLNTLPVEKLRRKLARA
jgi:DNA polymerase (family 10)